MSQLRTANKRRKRAALRRQAYDATIAHDRAGELTMHPTSTAIVETPTGL